MVKPTTQNSKYLPLPLNLEESDLDAFNELAAQPKEELSRKVYARIEAEESALRKSALSTLPRQPRSSRSRRLFLCRLPEHADTIKFIRANIRRPAFKAHLKNLILHSVIPPDVPFQPDAPQKTGLRSPRELFSQPPGIIIKAIIADLNGEGQELNTNTATHNFNWAEVPPDQYPSEVMDQRLFALLRTYWDQLPHSTA